MVELKDIAVGSKVIIEAKVKAIYAGCYTPVLVEFEDGETINLRFRDIASVTPPSLKQGDRATTAHGGFRGIEGEILKVRGRHAVVLWEDGTVNSSWPLAELYPLAKAA